MSKIVVPGGNGFIGTEICRLAVKNGHEVAAFGRRGRPSLSPARHPWIQDVEWRAADVFEPAAWRDLLDGADAVIHSIATIFERPEQNITYERVNADAALRVAEEAAEADVESFVFLSVRDTPPLVPSAFLEAKRRAEREVSEKYPDLRLVSLRPNLVYGKQKTGTAPLAAFLSCLEDFSPHSYATREGRPLPVELVAAAAVQSAIAEGVEGSLSINQIEDVGRTSGLVDPADVSEASLTPLLVGAGATALGAVLLRRLLRR